MRVCVCVCTHPLALLVVTLRMYFVWLGPHLIHVQVLGFLTCPNLLSYSG